MENDMGGVNKNLKALSALVRALDASEALEPGQKDAVVKALKKIRDGCNRKDVKLIEAGMAEMARTFLRDK